MTAAADTAPPGVSAAALTRHLAEFLKVEDWTDDATNGLQVEGVPEVRRLVTGVSACGRLFKEAVRLQAEGVLVHHGLFWRGRGEPFSLTGILKDRVQILMDHRINLWAFHLPLDGHPKIGNNILVARALGLEGLRLHPLGDGNPPLAVVGALPRQVSVKRFGTIADRALKTRGLALDLTGRSVKQVMVVTGAGSRFWAEAATIGADILVTGELREDSVRAAEEAGVNLYAGGHYNTEKLGVQALGDHLRRRFRLTVQFVDIPNPV